MNEKDQRLKELEEDLAFVIEGHIEFFGNRHLRDQISKITAILLPVATEQDLFNDLINKH